MKKLHHHFCQRSPFYHKWHQHPLHPHVHWGVLGAVVLGVALSLVGLGWGDQSILFSAQAQEQTVGLYNVFEASFTASGSYSNPYLQTSMTATFRGPSGQTITVDGFWDSGSIWKVRTAPTVLGTWTYTTSSADPGLNGKNGSLNVITSSKKGHIRVSKTYPYSFEYSDGTPFFWLGDTNWDFANKSTPFDGTFQKWIDTRVNQGFTVIQGTLEPTGSGGRGYPRYSGENEGGTIFTNYDVSGEKLNPGFFQWMDKRVQYVMEKNLALVFWFVWADDWNSGMNGDRYKRYARYLIARYGAYNVAWGVSGEYEEIGNPAAVREAGNFIKSTDPYKHPLSSHTVDTTADDFGNEAWIDFHGQQQWSNWNTKNALIIQDRAKGKPVVNMEYGYEGVEYSADDVRRAHWSIFLGGGFGTYGEDSIAWDKPVSWNTVLNLSAASQIKHLKNFINKIRWWEMTPSNNLVNTGYALANSGQEYIIYLPNGGSVNVNLSSASGSFAAEWYNPRTGVTTTIGTVTGGATRSFTAPDTNDWVLRLTKSNIPSSPAAPSNLTFDSVTQTSVRLSYTDHSNNESGFYLYRSTGSTKPSAPYHTNPPDDTDKTDQDLKCGITYRYWVEAYNAYGVSPHITGTVTTVTCPPPSDTIPPTVSLTAPAANATVSGTVTVSATASDNLGVTRVEFIVDGTVKSTDTASPYSFSWDTTNSGIHPCSGAHTHTLSARASDAVNNIGTSANVTVNMNNPVYCGSSVCGLNGCEAGETATSCPEDCGGSGSCPTTCITMGGDTCSDSLANATELPACSTAYCAPNYSPKRYCVKCNPGSTLNPATDRCETTGGGTTNQPPRNLVLRYLGPTPTGGNLCGNPPGRIDPGEQCDGTNLNNQTCQTLGFQSGTPACYPASSPSACQFNTIGCTNPPQQVCTPNQSCPYTSQNCAGICNAQGTACNDAVPNDGCPAPVSSDSYPLIGWQTFGAGVDDFNARFNLFVSRVSDAGRISNMRSKNPNIKVMYTEDWNAGCGINNPPPEWLLYTSNRQQIPIYDSGQGNGMRNLSKFAPRATAGAYAGKTYFEVCSDRMTNVDWGAFYGVFTDGLWGKDQMVFENKYGFFFQWPDIDMDGNFINDHNEIGPGKKWSSNQAWADDWQAGVDTLLRLIREKLNARAPGRPITLNVGSPFSWGRQWVNGFVVEKYSLRNGTNVTDPYAQNFQAQGQKPFTSFALGLVDPEDPERNVNPLREARDHLRAMRFGLVTAMFDDLYFSFQDPDEGNPHSPGASQEHYWSFWYDEFESDLGKPIDATRELKPGLGYRCFEKGIALANVDGASKTVTASDLSGLCGYSGVYYRLKSGQDLALRSLDANWTVLHDGSPLTSVTLNGVVYQKCYGGCLTIYRGDGLLLFRQPTTVVSDIIIDNNYMSTSPTQQLMQNSGFTQEGNCSAGTNYYAVRCAWNPESWAYAYAQPGSATATFRPSIGVAGNYEVLEWHGRLVSGTLASNVTHTITYAGGSTVRTVNQQANAGQWNSLGTYRFNAGTGGNVTLSAQGANGTVMADAIMFRYIGP